MKVLFITNSSGGLYRFRREVIEAFCERAEVYLCMPYNTQFMEHWEEIGCKYISCSFDRHGTNLLQELKLISFYKKTIDEVKPDICFTYTIKPNVYGGIVCASRKIPYVANVTGLGTAVESGGLLGKISLVLYKKGLKNAQKVFFQNANNLEFMIEHNIISGAYDLIPGSGVNLKQFELLEYPIDITNFSFISRIMKKKGIDQYLEAAEEIKKRHPDTRFHVFGICEEDYEEKLKELQDKGTIIYHGNASNMTEVYKMTSCTIHPTYYPEGMSNVLLESCACGRPIITTGRPGCREIVDDGINGFIVKQRDTQDLLEKIEKFLSLSIDQRKKMGLAGRSKVEREFDRQIVVQKYLKEAERIN